MPEYSDKKKKAKKMPAGKGAGKSPGQELIRAKAITTSKSSRGFSTKRPPKAHLSYPL